MTYLVAFILAINPYLSDSVAARYAMQLETYCNEPYLAALIIQAESSFRPHAIHHNTNGSIDVGLFQINSVHGYPRATLSNEHDNIVIGCTMLNRGTYSHSNKPALRAKYARKLARILMYGSL